MEGTIKIGRSLEDFGLLFDFKYKTILPYFLKCKKINKTYTQKFQTLIMVKQCYYENVVHVVLKK